MLREPRNASRSGSESSGSSRGASSGSSTPISWSPSKGSPLRRASGADMLAQPNVCLVGGGNPLHYAAKQNNPTFVSQLIAARGDPTQAQADGYSPLHIAASKGYLGVVKALLNDKTQIFLVAKQKNEKDANKTAIFYAAEAGHTEVVQYLATLSEPQLRQIDDETTGGETPLHAAVTRNNFASGKFLIENGAVFFKERQKAHLSPLFLAAEKGRLELLIEMLNSNPQAIRFKTKEGETLLHIAAGAGHKDTVKELLSRGNKAHLSSEKKGTSIPVNFFSMENQKGETPLGKAFAGYHWDVAAELMKAYHSAKIVFSETDQTSIRSMNEHRRAKFEKLLGEEVFGFVFPTALGACCIL